MFPEAINYEKKMAHKDDPEHVERAKRLSKILRTLLKPFLPDMKPSRCQNVVAPLMGFRDWHQLAKSPSLMAPYAELLDEDRLQKRRFKQREILSEAFHELNQSPEPRFVRRVVLSTRVLSKNLPKPLPELFNECREQGWLPGAQTSSDTMR